MSAEYKGRNFEICNLSSQIVTPPYEWKINYMSEKLYQNRNITLKC